MKIKNVEIGRYIQSKKDSKQLIAGHCYQVAEKDVSDKTVRLFSVDDSFDDSLWFFVSDFRKPRPQPQLKQLDQSIFDGLDEKWRFAMVSSVGIPFVYDYKPTGKRHFLSDSAAQLMVNIGKVMRIDEYDYDTTNWQNSLIERDIAKELLEVDLSSELTGSELCRAMLARGDYHVMCAVSDISESDAILSCNSAVITSGEIRGAFTNSFDGLHEHAVPINNQGEPLTAAEAGL